MKAFKALLKKDWLIRSRMLMLPAWINFAFIGGLLLIYIIKVIQGDPFIHWTINELELELQGSGVTIDDLISLLAYMGNAVIVFFPGFMGFIATVGTAQNALNWEAAHGTEIFHRSMPVSEWKITGSKFLTYVFGSWAVVLGVAIMNFILFNSILAFKSGSIGFLGYSITGMLQTYTIFMFTGIIIGSIAFFCSSIFKDAAIFKALVVMIAIEVFVVIVNYLFGTYIPSPTEMIFKSLFSFTVNFAQMDKIDFDNVVEMDQAVNAFWVYIFSPRLLINLMTAAILYGLATVVYKFKEVK